MCFSIDLRCVAQPGRAPGLGPGGRMFESCHTDQQWKISSAVEQRPYKAKVKSSILLSSTIYGELAELVEGTFLLRRQSQQKLGLIGSNPILSAIY